MTQGNLQDFIKQMESGVYNYTDNGKCISCGQCCSNVLPLSKEEIQTIKKYKRKHHIQDTTKQEGVGFNMMCPFRDEANKICTIYEVRPEICRDFKCDKPANQIKATQELYYSMRRTVFMREEFFK